MVQPLASRTLRNACTNLAYKWCTHQLTYGLRNSRATATAPPKTGTKNPANDKSQAGAMKNQLLITA